MVTSAERDSAFRVDSDKRVISLWINAGHSGEVILSNNFRSLDETSIV